jgi:hypothetical protein
MENPALEQNTALLPAFEDREIWGKLLPVPRIKSEEQEKTEKLLISI